MQLAKFAIFLFVQGLIYGCAVSPIGPIGTNAAADLEQSREPLLVVVNDPRADRARKPAPAPGYSTRIEYSVDPALYRLSRRIAADHGVEVLSEWPLMSLGVHCFVIEKPSSQQLAQLRADPRVRWVQNFNIHRVLSNVDSSTDSERSNYSDSIAASFLEQFGNNGGNGSKTSGNGVRMVVIDTGANVLHPALRDSDIRYENVVNAKGNGKDESHGTAVTGLIAAKHARPKNNLADATDQYDRLPASAQSGVIGLAQNAAIHHIRGCWENHLNEGICNTLTLALALEVAITIEPEIVNLSLSGPADPVLDALVQKLTNSGALVVTAFDQKRSLDERFPQKQPGVWYAYGVDSYLEGAQSLDENIQQMLFTAPRHALSLTSTGGYDLFTGHSIATPIISGIAATFWARDPTKKRDSIVSMVTDWLREYYQPNPPSARSQNSFSNPLAAADF